MTVEKLQKIFAACEGISVEFKQARTSLPENVFESICAFLNRIGGDLILGVADNGAVSGINPDRMEQIKSDLVNLSNNPNKLDPPFMLFPEEFIIDGKSVIYVRVPQSSQVHKSVSSIFDRNEDGDFKVKTSEAKDEVLQQIVPAYKTDALLRREDLDHYDDRREIRTNLVDAYDELMQFIRTHLPDKFYMEDDIRVDLREKIFREVVANILIHREFTNAFPARLIIYRNSLATENANNPVGHGRIDPDNFNPHPKNPAIVKFFQQLGRAEELGSGIRNIRKYLPLYAKNNKFELLEADNFKSIVHFELERTPQATPQATPQVKKNDPCYSS